MSEENKEVEQTESKAVKDAEQTECEADKEVTQIETKEEQTENSADKEENEAGKEAGQMEIETEADQETDQAEAEEIETKDQAEVAATAAAYHRMSLSIRVSMNRSINGKKEKRSLRLYQFLWAELFYFVILHCRSGLVSILTRIHILTDRMYPIIQ